MYLNRNKQLFNIPKLCKDSWKENFILKAEFPLILHYN